MTPSRVVRVLSLFLLLAAIPTLALAGTTEFRVFFDDELRIWITDDLLALEIAEDGTWVECSADEVLDPATLVLSD